MTIAVRGVLFDMDGVLISSIDSAVRCWKEWARMYNVPDADNFELPHGTPAPVIIREAAPWADAAEALKTIEDLEIADAPDLTVLRGVAQLLAVLPADRWAIVTSATTRLVMARVAGAKLPLPTVLITSDMVKLGKPHPEPYLLGAEKLGLAAADCLVVEDAPAGVAAGKAAGCKVLGLLTSHAQDDLKDADWIVPSLAEVQAVVEGDVIRLTFEPVAR